MVQEFKDHIGIGNIGPGKAEPISYLLYPLINLPSRFPITSHEGQKYLTSSPITHLLIKIIDAVFPGTIYLRIKPYPYICNGGITDPCLFQI